MNPHRRWTTTRPSLALVLVLALALPAAATVQTDIDPGFNLFSTEQDVEIGRQSADEVDQQLPLLSDRTVGRYVTRVGERLAAQAPYADYPYQFGVVDLADINAFALPGGYMYVNRGLLRAVRNEGELAGVMAHEIAHVALRHGTNQASKAYLAQAGLSVLGGLLGGSGTTGDIIGAVGGFGLNALFLDFSRDAEEEADIVGAQILARAGYDPLSMVDMFETLQGEQQRQPGAVERFFSSHPTYAERQATIRHEAELLGRVDTRHAVGGLDRVQERLAAMPAAPTMQEYVADDRRPQDRRTEDRRRSDRGGVSIESPSSRFETFTQRSGYFEVAYPDNWRVFEADNGFGATIAPPGGVVTTDRGREDIVYGVVINHYEPFQGRFARRGQRFSDPDGLGDLRTTLAEATDDLVRTLQASNPHLEIVPNSRHEQRIDEGRAVVLVLAGESTVTGREERVTLFARETGDEHVIYALMIAPTESYPEMSRTFDRMIRSLRVDDEVAHR